MEEKLSWQYNKNVNHMKRKYKKNGNKDENFCPDTIRPSDNGRSLSHFKWEIFILYLHEEGQLIIIFCSFTFSRVKIGP